MKEVESRLCFSNVDMDLACWATIQSLVKGSRIRGGRLAPYVNIFIEISFVDSKKCKFLTKIGLETPHAASILLPPKVTNLLKKRLEKRTLLTRQGSLEPRHQLCCARLSIRSCLERYEVADVREQLSTSGIRSC